MQSNEQHGPTVRRAEALMTHVAVETDQPYAQVVQAFEARIGRHEFAAYTRVIEGAATPEAFARGIEALVGESGFMSFLEADHGEWFTRYFGPLNAKLYVIGNPIIAKDMLVHAGGVGLYVPLRVLIYEDAPGHTRIDYDEPSSLMRQFNSAEILTVASSLDTKLADLAMAAARGDSGEQVAEAQGA